MNRAAADDTAILEASAAIRTGGVVVFPTHALYGLGADAFNATAVQRVFAIKRRAAQNPILILIRGLEDLAQVVSNVPVLANRIMQRFWPGGVTLVLTAQPAVPEALTAGTGKIGVRWPGHPVAQALVKAAGGPITGTSANLAGQPGCSDIDRLDATVAAEADVILDAGQLAAGAGSTVVDVTTGGAVILREGTIPAEAIQALAGAAGQTC